MPALSTDLRNELARVIVSARREAEEGARKALESLAVERHEPHGPMTPEDRNLRNRLRARGRQLGDVRDRARGTQSIERLTHEVAYEHWHRMLFARFLAENDFLIHPEHGVPISTNDIDELAREAGETPRDLAARFAQYSLPQIFRGDDPVLEVAFAPETRQALDRLLDSLPSEVFDADDSLGWTYQYWQAEKKNAVNESGNKIGADELPAVTQLFTEHYMVSFLFHNTIGAWHAGKVLAENPSLAETAETEEELRRAVRLRSQGGYEWEYLRFVRETKKGDEEGEPTGPWRPAAGSLDGWPTAAKDLKVLDPCCGSGHFLVEGLELLVRLRMDEESLGLDQAIDRVLSENLHGLEIDARCTQIAAFNLAMASWKLLGRHVDATPMRIACSGLSLGSTRKEWLATAGDDDRLRAGMDRLYDLFEQAPDLGSLINPRAVKGNLLVAEWSTIEPLLQQVLDQAKDDDESTERAVTAQGMAEAVNLLKGSYHLVITNVPYLGLRKQAKPLRDYCVQSYSYAKEDLATAFLARSRAWLDTAGVLAVVSPQNWFYQYRYRHFRERLLKECSIHLCGRLGERGFQSAEAAGAFVALTVISSMPPSDSGAIALVDVSAEQFPDAKAAALVERKPTTVLQVSQLDNPDARLSLEQGVSGRLLNEFVCTAQGIKTGDDPYWVRNFWEVGASSGEWRFYQTSSPTNQLYGGRSWVINWGTGGQGMTRPRTGSVVVGKRGVVASAMRSITATLYEGDLHYSLATPLVPLDQENLAAVWCYCSSPDYNTALREIEQNIAVTTDTLAKVPFDLTHWQGVAAKQFPDGLPDPSSDDPTQWLFHGHPAAANPAYTLQVAVGRLLGYRWPPELDLDMRLSAEAREWVKQCEALLDLADTDGVVCLSPIRGERSAADRLREILAVAFGPEWSGVKERHLLAAVANGRSTTKTLEIWLRDHFFKEHCRLFDHRPFVWQIWDGNRDGFSCLVNSHKLTAPAGAGRRLLKAITYSYLGNWIDRQKADQQAGREGADARLASAQDLQSQLERVLEGEPPFDVFVRWKSLAEQAAGWEPDINDGIRLNIRPFMKAELRSGGKKGAGILRWKPNITWKKDRGKEPGNLRKKTESPWFWGCPGDGSLAERTDYIAEGTDFDGNRWNDLHYTNACKKAARERVAKGTAV